MSAGRHGGRPLLVAALLALGGCPATAATLLDRADDLAQRRQFSKAQTAYRDALRRLGDEDTAQSRELRTRGLAHLADLCYLDLGDTKCAAESYRRLIDNYPEAPETFQARQHVAEMLRDRLGDVPGAIAQYKALATAYPGKAGSDDFQYQVAEGYFTLRDYVQARSEARALLDRFAGSSRASQARFLIASCFEFEGQRPEAIKAFEDLLARDPSGELASKARLALAKLLEQQGERARALQLLSQGTADPAEAAFVIEERRRLARQLALEKPLSRAAIFGEHGGRVPAGGRADPSPSAGEGAPSIRHTFVGGPKKIDPPNGTQQTPVGHDPFGDEGE